MVIPSNLSNSVSSGCLTSSSSRKDKARSMEGRVEESGDRNVERVVGGSSTVSLKEQKTKQDWDFLSCKVSFPFLYSFDLL